MTTKEQIKVFEKLMKKAKKGGYTINLGTMPLEAVIEYKIYYKFIFNHDFAKAIWGNELVNITGAKPLVLKEGKKIVVNGNDYELLYILNLKKMVAENDYLEYLKQFV